MRSGSRGAVQHDRMLGVIKKLFHRKGAQGSDTSTISRSLDQQRGGNVGEYQGSTGSTPEPIAEGESLRISMKTLAAGLPKEVQGKNSAASSDLYVTVPKALLLAQLSQGAFRIPFALVRKAAPAGVFPNTHEYDTKLVDLPLRETLKSLGPAAFSRRTGQKAMNVSEEIADIFGAKGQNIRILSKEEAKAATTGTKIDTSHRKRTEDTSMSAFGVSPNAPKPEAAPAVEPEPTPPTAEEPIRFRGSLPGAAPTPRSAPTPAPAVPRPAAAARPAAPVPAGPEHLVLEMAEISANWPEPLRRELTRFEILKSKCHLPTSEVQDALKQGRVNFTWKQLASYVKPTVQANVGSAHESTILELPIAVVASAFFSQTQAAKASRPAQQPARTPLADVSVFQQAGSSMPAAPAPTPRPVASPPPAPAAAPAPAPIRMAHPAPAPVPAIAPAATAPSADGPVVPVSVSQVCAKWPEGVRKEIEHLDLGGRTIQFPAEAIEAGLKTGKVEFFWKQVCSWMQNCPAAAQGSAFGDTRVEVPLSVVAPIFLKHKPAGPKKAATFDDIPDVFGPSGQITAPPESAPAPPPRPRPAAPAPAPVARPVAPAPAPAPVFTPAASPARAPVADGASGRTAAKNLAELFGEPEKRNWTPNEIVQRTTHLPGVAGALIALQDGLLVAQCMPPNSKTETIAAFLPQIFGRLSQYAKELNMGELQSANVTVEQGTLQIYKAGIIYFAVLGHPEGPLPLPSLNLIATELSRHTK